MPPRRRSPRSRRLVELLERGPSGPALRLRRRLRPDRHRPRAGRHRAQVLVRIREDRVFYADAPPRPNRPSVERRPAAPPRQADEVLGTRRPTASPTPSCAPRTADTGRCASRAWHGLHPRLSGRGRWGKGEGAPRSCAAASSVSTSSISQSATDERTRRCGCGGRAQASQISSCASGPICTASTSSTPSGSRRTRWAGRRRRCARPSRRTAGRG